MIGITILGKRLFLSVKFLAVFVAIIRFARNITFNIVDCKSITSSPISSNILQLQYSPEGGVI